MRKNSDEEPIQVIQDDLYLGGFIRQRDLSLIEEYGINAILDVTIEFDAAYIRSLDTEIEYLCIPIFDHSIIRLDKLHQTVLWMDEQRSLNRRILIHCALGRGRSAMILLAYLIYRNPNTPLRLLLQNVQSIRSTVKPNFRQMLLLERYQNSAFIKRQNSILAIINPSAGRADLSATQITHTIENCLSDLFVVKTEQTTPERDADIIAQEAIESGVDLIVACGGDGTVSKIAKVLAGTDIALGIIPLGTANALASSLYGLDVYLESIEASCERIKQFNTKKMDTFTCNNTRGILLAGIGYECDMTLKANQDGNKAKLGPLAYVQAAVESVGDLDPFEVTVTLDGKSQTFHTTSVVVANAAPKTSVFAQGAREPSPYDSFLNITWIEMTNNSTTDKMMSLFDILSHSSGLDIPLGDFVKSNRGKHICIESENSLSLVLDGEIMEGKVFDLKIDPKSLKAIC